MGVIDSRCPWVTFQDGFDVHVQAVDYVPADLSQGRLGIYVFAHRNKFLRWGVPYALALPGSLDLYATMPEFRIDMAGGLFYPDRGEAGPFSIRCGDAIVKGMGLPANLHVVYVVTFKLLGVI